MIFGLDLNAGKPAIRTDKGELLLYSDLIEAMNRVSAHLGERKAVAICLCENSVDCISGYLSFLDRGVVPIMVSAQTEPAFVQGYIAEYRPRYIWKPRSLRLDVPGFSKAMAADDYELLTSLKEAEIAIHPELAVLATTSGSTGSRKLVRQSRSNLLENTRAIVESLGLHEGLSTITTLPVNYTFGMSIIHTHLSVGSCVHLTSYSIAQKEFWDRMRSQQVGILYGVPFTFDMLKKLRINRQDLPNLQALAQAGGKLPAEIGTYFTDWCNSTGKRFYIMYGQAEATTRISCFCASDHPDKIASAGKPLSGGNVEIRRDQTEAACGGDTGEIVYHGPNVCMGYASGSDDLAKEDEWHGELATGDLGRFDPDGYLHITGRKKRFVKLYGHSISLDDIEKQLADEVIGTYACVSDQEQIVVFYSERADVGGLSEELAGPLKLRPADFRFVRIDRIPRTENGKVNYHELNRLIPELGV